MSYRVGVDIGGTFTDFAVFDESARELHTIKVLSRPDAPGTEVLEGLRQVEQRHGVKPAEVRYFTHGMTVGINTVIQRKGIRLALFTTRNFEDVLEVARLKTPDPYDLFSRRAVPLVTRERVFGIRERILADGSVDLPVDEASVLEALAKAKRYGVEGIVVSLLNCYRNAAHEAEVRRIVQRAEPGLPVYLSSEIWPVVREYERTVTATVGSYPQPRVAHYLSSLQRALKEIGVPADPLITKSNGGIMSAELGKTDSVQILLSGTAAGVIGAAHVARLCGIGNCMSLDVGGTSADVALVVDGTPQYGIGEMIGEFPIFIPTVAVTSIGAGGGSIAWVDPLGVLKVGPESAGSNPGPACYARGGERPTITDAFVVCGFLGRGELGYSAVRIDAAKAEAAVGGLAQRLGLGLRETAEAIIKVAVSGMFMEVSKLVSRYGVDVRDFALLPFGGAGPMLGCFLARELGMSEVVVPTTPGVLSALGGLIADVKNDFIRSVFLDLDENAVTTMRDVFGELRQKALAWLRDEQGFAGEPRLVYSADMRYRGQSFEIETVFDAAAVERGDIASIGAAFHAQHKRIYEYSDAAAPVQMINLRLVAIGESPKPALKKLPASSTPPKPAETIEVWFDAATNKVPVFRRRELEAGQRFDGPAVVTQDDCTTCVPKGYAVEVDAYGNLRLRSTR